MIACACGLNLLDDRDYLSHRSAMDKLRGEKGKHVILCVKCRQPAKEKEVQFWIACDKIESIMCDSCVAKIKERIENGCYPPGKRR